MSSMGWRSAPLLGESADEILARPGLKIERIVSHHHASPPGFWYEQACNEWVIVLSGCARLRFEGEAEPRPMKAGDYVFIPASKRHRVDWTSESEPTLWLAVHFDAQRQTPWLEGAGTDMNAKPVTITVDDANEVSGLLMAPRGAKACYVLAHGAGAGMTHPFMAAIAEGLAARGIGTFRYQFPYMEKGSKRPDPPKLAQATVRSAAAKAMQLLPDTALIAGGKSFGGRMTSQAQAAEALPNVRGLAFLGFPLHPAGKPSTERGNHLSNVDIPMLFLQGTRDALAETEQLEPLIKALGPRATLRLIQDADHSFHVPVRSGRRDLEVRNELLDVLSAWVTERSAH